MQTKLFISYSRQDRDRVERLYDALDAEDEVKVFRDTDDILPTEEWKPRLEKLIRESDVIIFALTPQSAASEVCAWELELAESLNKRIIPVVVENVDGQVPSAIAKLNYIFLTPQDDLAHSLTKIQDAISLDIDWIREHTRLGELADRWQKAMRLGAQPLRGRELDAAEQWLVTQFNQLLAFLDRLGFHSVKDFRNCRNLRSIQRHGILHFQQMRRARNTV